MNKCKWFSVTALMKATGKPHNDAEKLVNLLIEAGADVNIRDCYGKTVLICKYVEFDGIAIRSTQWSLMLTIFPQK